MAGTQDLDEWVLGRREEARGGREYSDTDFLADVSNFLSAQTQVQRPQAFGPLPEEEDAAVVKGRFLRSAERESLQYRDPSIGRLSMDMLGDVLCCLVHDKNDLVRDEPAQRVCPSFMARSPEPKVVQIGPRYFVTPGEAHAAPAEQTCGLLEMGEGGLTVQYAAFRLDGLRGRWPSPLLVGGKTKLSIKGP